MEHVCQTCGNTTHSGKVPRFCSECGSRFETSGVQDEATLPPEAPVVEEMATMAPSAASSPTTQQRDVLSGYQITRELGRGGMGVVYEALEDATGRKVALKLLAAGVDRSEEAVQRFLHEGKIAASLSHPRSTFVYDAGETDGRFFITMELMSGGTVKDVVDREGKLAVAEAVNHTLDMLDGLEAAHEIGVVHRDVKPSNCFLTADGRVKVGDFGISKSLVSDAELTQTGAFMGTPMFAAPEQIRAATVDNRTDIYSVGATLFYMLAGRAPFQGDAIQVVADIVSETPPALASIDPDIPDELSQIIARTLEKNPSARPQTASELRLALLPFSDRTSSISDVGRRMAAFFVDTTLASLSINALVILLVLAVPQASVLLGQTWPARWCVTLITAFMILVYFAYCESRWGRGVGKRLMGLRVVNHRGESPSFGKALLRAAIVPGAANGVRSVTPLIVGQWLGWDPLGMQTAPDQTAMVLNGLVFPFASAVVGLGMVATMRRHNGYRGLHELATGTRVVRVEPARALENRHPVTVPVREVIAAGGQYEVAGRLCQTPEYSIYAATDRALGRPVWLIRNQSEESRWSPGRMEISRGSRQHILRSHVAERVRWDALEAVTGIPFTAAAFDVQEFSWPVIRAALIDLSEELIAATNDGTLPEQLTVGQVWLDASGRMKLLDVPVCPDHDEGSSSADRDLNPVQLLVAILHTCQALLPGQGLDLLRDLNGKPDKAETLEWAKNQLHDLGDRPGRLSWDDRLGMLAISFGTEYAVVQAAMVLLGLLVLPLIGVVAIPIIFAVIAPAVVGYIFRGGPVFRIARVQPRRKGIPASPVRCAVRNAVAWIPCTVGTALLMWFVIELFLREAASRSTASLYSLIIAGFLLLIFICGALLTIAMPRRSLQDLIAGTELVAE